MLVVEQNISRERQASLGTTGRPKPAQSRISLLLATIVVVPVKKRVQVTPKDPAVPVLALSVRLFTALMPVLPVAGRIG